MEYYLNEYSLRGQFQSLEDFYDSLRKYTLPVLNEVWKRRENTVWKKDVFWQCEICNGITVDRIPEKKNERSPEKTKMKVLLARLCREAPFWDGLSLPKLKIKEYCFDEEYRDRFDDVNSFVNAVVHEGRIISFLHPSYQICELSLVIVRDHEDVQYSLDNVYTPDFWKTEPKVVSWRIGSKYLIEIRANEFDYHPPHFHVTYSEYAAVFNLKTGEMYTSGKYKWSSQMISEIQDWYCEHREEMLMAWDKLHKK